ncbi:MAG: hypothetical protein WA777_19750, partial [Rhodanobacter sp.]
MAAILSTPVIADVTPATSNTATPSDTTSADAPQTQNAKNLGTVQVSSTVNTVNDIAPTQGSTVAIQPQSIISGLYLQENVPPTGDYTDAISIAP